MHSSFVHYAKMDPAQNFFCAGSVVKRHFLYSVFDKVYAYICNLCAFRVALRAERISMLPGDNLFADSTIQNDPQGRVKKPY